MLRSSRTLTSPSWKSLLQTCKLDSVDAVYRCMDGDVVTRSGSTEVRRVELAANGGPRVVYIKKYWASSARQLWSGALRGTFLGRSKVHREYENMARLRGWGLDAPAPVAYGEERFARWLVRSFLISEGIPNPLPLNVLIRDGLARSEDRRFRRALIEHLADYTRRLHERRFVHHDYFWRNIILAGQNLDRFFLIDAHKGERWRPWAARRCRAKDLATLDAPAPHFFRRTERLRFFLRYAGHPTLTRADKKLIESILRQAQPMREGQLRRVLGGRRI